MEMEARGEATQQYQHAPLAVGFGPSGAAGGMGGGGGRAKHGAGPDAGVV